MRPRAPVQVYVYYRVAADSAAGRDAVAALFAAVQTATGVAGRLLARHDDPAMWLEIYAPVNDAVSFVRRLDALARGHRIADLAADGKRHVECFAPLPALQPVAAGRPPAARAR